MSQNAAFNPFVTFRGVTSGCHLRVCPFVTQVVTRSWPAFVAASDSLKPLHLCAFRAVDARFDGSTSIKKVLPVLCPELDYSDLDVQDGSSAMAEWERMIRAGSGEADEIAHALLRYCERDTRALVEIHGFLRELVESVKSSSKLTQDSRSKLTHLFPASCCRRTSAGGRVMAGTGRRPARCERKRAPPGFQHRGARDDRGPFARPRRRRRPLLSGRQAGGIRILKESLLWLSCGACGREARECGQRGGRGASLVHGLSTRPAGRGLARRARPQLHRTLPD